MIDRQYNIIVLHKLDQYDIRGVGKQLFTSCITSRILCVIVNDITYNIITTTIGVPQGSVLVNHLFNICVAYINA